MANYTKEKQFELIRKYKGWNNLQNIDNQYEEVCIEAVKQNGLALEYVKEQTPEICIEAVKENGKALKYVKEQTREICLEAVKQNGWALYYVNKQAPEICLEAVKQDGGALCYVKEQTLEICLEAIKEDADALKYVKEQTREICLEAVKQDGKLIKYVKEQTSEICMEAVKENGHAIEYVKKQTPELCFYAYLNSPIVDWDFDIKRQRMKFMSEGYIKNKVFCEMYYSKKINKDVYYFDERAFRALKDYLLNEKNSNNEFMLYDTSEDELIKEISLSNNKLTIINTGNINNTHKILANKIVDFEELKKEGINYDEIPF